MAERNPGRMNRRGFLKHLAAAAAGAAAFPAVVPASALGRGGSVAPSDRIVMAGIGFGMMGIPNMRSFLNQNDVQWVAVCDLDERHLAEAKGIVDSYYGHRSCAVYHDYRDLAVRGDLDAVSIAVPDHWHALVAVEFARAGCDIYGEKPLTHSLSEGRALCDAVNRYGRVWQTGSWQRSVENFHHAAELVRSGRIGKVLMIEVGLPAGHYDFAGTAGQETMGPPPAYLDYDFWLGPAPWAPYCPARVHMNWRWNMDFGGGQFMDWVGHHADIAHWGMGWDRTGPVEIRGQGEYERAGVWNSPTRYYLTARYADGTPMVIAGGHPEVRSGTRWIGERGWVWVDRGDQATQPASLWREEVGPGEERLERSRDHYRNFLDRVRSRGETIAPCEVAHRSASVGHLGMIAIQLGRPIRWDPVTETFPGGDPEAARLLGHAFRSPWRLPQ